METMSAGQATYGRLFLGSLALALFISLLGSTSRGAQAQGSPAPVQKIEDQPANIQAQLKSLSEKIDSIPKDQKEAADESKTKPKDFWDILAELSGLITGGLVALIGIFATLAYNNRANKVAQVQVISGLINHLQSNTEHERQAALLAIRLWAIQA